MALTNYIYFFRANRFEEKFFPKYMVDLLWEQNVDEEMEREYEDEAD